MKKNQSQEHLGIQKQACRWVARLADNDHTVAEINTLERWLDADPQHQRAFEDAWQVWQLSGALKHLQPKSNLPVLSGFEDLQSPVAMAGTGSKPKRIRYWAGGFAVAATVLVAAVLTLGGQWWPNSELGKNGQYVTAVGEMETIELTDGSEITLAPSSILTVQYDDERRHIVLHKGEAFFEVEKRESDPFSVSVAGTLVRVMGTSFDIKHTSRTVRVAVEEGTVQVTDRELEPIDDSDNAIPKLNVSTIMLSAGQQVIAARTGELQSVRDINQYRPGAWRNGRLYYENAPLHEIVEDANRYSHRKVQLLNADLGELKVNTSIQVDAIDDRLPYIVSSLGLKMELVKDDRFIIKKSG